MGPNYCRDHWEVYLSEVSDTDTIARFGIWNMGALYCRLRPSNVCLFGFGMPLGVRILIAEPKKEIHWNTPPRQVVSCVARDIQSVSTCKICMHLHPCMYMYMYVCIDRHTSIYSYIRTFRYLYKERQTDRQTGRQTDR